MAYRINFIVPALLAVCLSAPQGLADGPGTPMIDFPPEADIAACRGPSVVPDDIDSADAAFPCRQMKIVQHWLGTMTDPRNAILASDAVPGVDAATIACVMRGPLPADDDDDAGPFDLSNCDPLAIEPEIRRQVMFGAIWDTQLQIVAQGDDCDAACYKIAVEEFDSTLRGAFNRIFALLVAASVPLDRDDALEGEDWWWELPGVYAAEPDLIARQQMMVEDANEWIETSGIWVYTHPGTPNNFHDDFFDDDDLNTVDNIGDYDFMFSELMQLIYALKDRPDLLGDDAIRVLLQKNWTLDDDPGKAPFIEFLGVEPVEWLDTAIPVSGQGFAAEMVSINSSGKIEFGLSETENHVLMTLMHYYLVNQWIAEDYRGNMQDVATPGLPEGETIESWYATNGTSLEQAVRDALARIVHADLFETNARPYQSHAIAPIFVLATHAENPVVRAEAENALHFIATKFAFQALDGRRSTPMRRNCGYADSLTLYIRDGTALGLGLLTGAYKWNDSPYGMRASLAEPNACFQDGAQDCYFHRYTWKVDEGKDDSLGEHIAATGEELSNDRIDGGGQIKNLLIAFSGYRVPRPVHAFLLDRDRRHFARMMSRYDDEVYRPSRNAHTGIAFAVDGPFASIGETELRAKELGARYFSGDELDDSSENNERAPEFYFHGPGFVNTAGGTYNPYLYRVENSYMIERNPFPYQGSCTGASRSDEFLENTENYDFLSRPYMILPEVPTVFDTEDEDGDGDTAEPLYYRPFGLSGDVVFADDNPDTPDDENPETVDLLRHVPMMRGNQNEWYKSANSATFKNFSYGYRIRKDGSTIGTYAKLGWEWPINLPPGWLRCVREVDDLPAETAAPEEVGCPAWIPRRSFQFGALGPLQGDVPAARFELYDARAYMNATGQRGYVLVTAKLRKNRVEFWAVRVARGFWEVIPEGFQLIADVAEPAAALELVEETIRDRNNPDWMRLNYVGKHKHFSYRLVTSEDVVRMSQYYGGVFDGLLTHNEGRVQGLIRVTDPDGNTYDLANVFQRFMDNGVMNDMPLIDVKAVDESFRFAEDEDGLHYYACARDGWVYVNNPRDGSWLFADSRRSGGLPAGDPGTPYWLAGTFEEDGEWTPRPSCGFGSGGGWTPSPPSNGVTEDCSGVTPCPQPGGGSDDGRPDPNGGTACEPSLVTCLSSTMCRPGEICLAHEPTGNRRCQCDRLPRPDLRPVTVQITQIGGGLSGEGQPGAHFCSALGSWSVLGVTLKP